VPDERWGEVGAAYVVADGVSADELLAWCESRLARFKVPKSINLVGEIPRNGMGKVQKQDLGRKELAR
jgi:acyl-CoA synthetase (AMP-forming)/AMP-acid ligase II